MTEVTCAIIIENERILVTQRSEKMPHPLKWEFPGGKVKEGESPEYCIKREIREELGLKVAVKQLLPSVKHTYGNHSIKLIPFICSREEGKISLSEHKSYKWVPMEKLEAVDWLDADLEVVRVLKTGWEGDS
ncbi:MAG: (deoxy)nucleoside triphosphate pyrophosphohydrolase [Bacteroidota bacterium]